MQQKRPNIVLFMTDQQRYDTIAALGYPFMHTPHIDRLVNDGVSFSNCFVTAASCAPSRASFFTGYYPHTTGINKNADLWRHSWVENLADAGYYCVNIGKMHTYPWETPLGFHERFVVENKDRYLEGRYLFDRWDMFLQSRGVVKQQREFYRRLADYRERLGAFTWDLPEDTHPDTFVGDLACWWLQNKPVDEPFFLQIGFPGPHPPYDPVPRYLDHYRDKQIPAARVTEQSLEGQPAAQKELRTHNTEVDHDSVAWSKNPTPEQIRRLREHYLANVTMIDEKVGAVIETLRERGLLENSIIVFTSDHGDSLGDHGHIQKWTMYDEITRVPLVVVDPGAPDNAGKRVDALCQHFDIVPYLFERAGVPVPDTWEAESVAPYLDGTASATRAREYVFAEQAQDFILTGTRFMTMIRSREWKLVHYADEGDEGELYDLSSDPDELQNLYHDSSHRKVRDKMLSELLKWRILSDVRTADWAADRR